MRNMGKRLSREERDANIAAARKWRADNKPYFDALYGPETVRATCPTCGRRGSIPKEVA